MTQRSSTLTVLSAHATTLAQMLRYFSRAKRLFMLPLLVFLFISGILLVATGGLSYVAPFVYAVF